MIRKTMMFLMAASAVSSVAAFAAEPVQAKPMIANLYQLPYANVAFVNVRLDLEKNGSYRISKD